MRTTLELGQEIGYARLSIEAIAARAGAGKHTIYRRWPSKGSLFLITQEPLTHAYADRVLQALFTGVGKPSPSPTRLGES